MNNILDSTNNDIIPQISRILEKAINGEQSNTDEQVIREITALLNSEQSAEVDTHGLVIHGLEDAAQATLELAQQGWFRQWCNISYDRNTQKVTTEMCLVGNKPSIISLLSPSSTYICTTIRPMTQQEIADKVFSAVNRNIEMALVSAKYHISEAFQEALMVLSRWEAFIV